MKKCSDALTVYLSTIVDISYFFSVRSYDDEVRLQGSYSDELMELLCIRSSFWNGQDEFLYFDFIFEDVFFRAILC